MKLLRFIVQRKVLILLLTIFIMILGGYTFTHLEKELNPEVGLDAASIDIDASNMNVEDVEEKVTKQVEQKLADIDGIKEISSTSSLGHAAIQVIFENGQGDELFREVESKTSLVLSDVPDIDHINAYQEGVNASFEFILDISDGDIDEMSAFAENIVKPRIEELSEVREVRLTGLLEHQVDVQFNQEKMDENNVKLHDVIELIQQGNNEEILGEFTDEKENPTVRWETTFQYIEALKGMQIPTDNEWIDLDEIATVQVNPTRSSSNTWKNGTKDLVMIEVGRKSDISQNDMTEAVRDELQNIHKEGLVDGFSVNEVIAHSDFVNDSMSDVTMNIIIGGIIAIVILLLFLRNIRTTVIIGLSIPTSILLTIIAMGLLDYTMNLLTLIGLGLGIGMMVDSSIVILESIYKKKEQGLNNLNAVLEGTKEVATPVIASALTTIVVFLPIGFIGGDSGKFMMILAVVVAITLISSVVIAFTLIPTLAEKLIKLKTPKQKPKQSKMLSIYKNIILWCVQKKTRSILIIVSFLVVFSASFLLIPKIPMNIMPDMFNRYTEIVVDLENGVTQKEKENIAEKINKSIHSLDDVEANYVLDFDDKMIANIVMTKGDQIIKDQDLVTEEILQSLRELEKTEPIRAVERALDGVSGYPVEVNISGDDFSKLKDVTNDVQEEIASIEGIVGISNNGEDVTEMQTINLIEKELKDAGLTPLQIKQKVEEFLLQETIGIVEWENEELFLHAKWDDEQLAQKSLLQTEIPTENGNEKLSSFITFEKEDIPKEIIHKNGERNISIMADVESRDLGSVNQKVQNKLDQYKDSADYSIALGGDLEEQNQLMNELLFVLGIALFLVFVVMAVQFNHFGHPLIVMAIIPVTVVGVILGLFITQAELNIMSGLGLLILVGIVLNNAILIIDRTNQLRKEGAPVVDALIQAGENRIRPIFMTTLTTIGGMLPLALATGMSADYQAPLAIVIISGLLFSTLITLLLIPSIYRVFSKE